MAKKKAAKKTIHHTNKAHKHHILKRHFPTFYERPIFGVGVLALALITLFLFSLSH